MLRLVLILGVVAVANGQKLFFGECPDVTVQENFTIPEYMGIWYEVKRFPTVFELLADCVTANYTLQDNGKVLVKNTGCNKITREYSSIEGEATQTPDEPAKLKIKFQQTPKPGDYWVISTDYESYSIVWSCFKVPLLPVNFQSAWILTRDPEGLEDEVMDRVDEILAFNGIDKEAFQITSQEDCPER